MVYAFTGSHRSGKTTLAKAVAQELDIPFYETRSGDVLKAAGINLVGNLSIEDRMAAQELLLDHHVKTLAELPRPLIVDRCPLDMFAYTLAEIGMHTVTDEALDQRLQRYLSRCLTATELHYAGAVLCPPLPSYDAQDGKPPPSVTYQAHIHTLISGAIEIVDAVSFIALNTPDPQKRLDLASDFIVELMDEMEKAKADFWVQ